MIQKTEKYVGVGHGSIETRHLETLCLNFLLDIQIKIKKEVKALEYMNFKLRGGSMTREINVFVISSLSESCGM